MCPEPGHLPDLPSAPRAARRTPRWRAPRPAGRARRRRRTRRAEIFGTRLFRSAAGGCSLKTAVAAVATPLPTISRQPCRGSRRCRGRSGRSRPRTRSPSAPCDSAAASIIISPPTERPIPPIRSGIDVGPALQERDRRVDVALALPAEEVRVALALALAAAVEERARRSRGGRASSPASASSPGPGTRSPPRRSATGCTSPSAAARRSS